MVSASKKLPCNHIFHTACLRSWFQRQQTCPTCRLNILRPATANAEPRPQNQPQGPTPAPQTAPTGINQDATPTPVIRTVADMRAAISQGRWPPPTTMPFFATPFPAAVPLPPVPTPPPNLSTLSEDELRAMEGNLRQAVETRIQTLQRVQLLLDAANAMMNQYQSAAATANIPIPTATAVINQMSETISKETPSSPKPTTEIVDEPTTKNPTTSNNRDDESTRSGSSTDGTLPSTSRGDEEMNVEQAALRKRRLQKFSVQPAAD